MNLRRAIEFCWGTEKFIWGITIYTYQITCGISIRWYYGLALRIHFLCFKIWFTLFPS